MTSMSKTQQSGNSSLRGIFPQVLGVILLVALIPSGALLLASRNDSQQQRQLLDKSLEEIGTSTSVQVNNWIDINQRVLKQGASVDRIVAMEPSQQLPLLTSLQNAYEWTYVFTVFDKEGNSISRSDGKENRYYGDREYFQQVKGGQEFGQQVLISRANNKPALCMSSPIEQETTFVGALLSCSFLTNISDLVVDTQIGETGFAFLVDDQGRVIAHGREELINEELQDFSDNPAVRAGILNRPFEFEENGRKVLAYAETTDLGWTLFVQQDASEALAPARKRFEFTLLTVGATLGTTLLLAYLFANRLVRPIRSLTEVADAVSRGQLDVSIDGTERKDEIGALARSVKRLSTSVKVAFEQLKRKS